MNKHVKSKQTIAKIGMVVGLLIIVVGFIAIFGFTGIYLSAFSKDMAFGADYYTHQYLATVKAVSNIAYLGVFVESAVNFSFKVGGSLMVALGILVICYFGIKYMEARAELANSNSTEQRNKSIANNISAINNHNAVTAKPTDDKWLCDECGTSNDKLAPFCKGCGKIK